jgi:hypothetical protein
MGTPHKHRDVIIAWANGEEIEYLSPNNEGWLSIVVQNTPGFYEHYEYRIKPKRVKKEGWVNVYETGYGNLFPTKEQADNCGSRWRTACIRIEWEEEA